MRKNTKNIARKGRAAPRRAARKRPIPKAKPQPLNSLGRQLLSALGGGAGAMLAGPAGAAAGHGLGNSIATWLGMGSYKISRNSLLTNGVPQMHTGGESIVVRHREYLSDVITSANVGQFAIESFALNPGLDTSFPWLSGIAQQYQEYTWKGLIFEYVSTSGSTVIGAGSLGSIEMATQYRSTAAPFTNKVTMLNEHFSTDGKPSIDFCHPVECDPAENPFNIQYVRGAAVPIGEDPKMYDLGTFSIASVGSPAASVNVGELWVSYEVELRKPQVADVVNLYGESAHYVNAAASTTSNLGTNGLALAKFDSIGLKFTGTTVTLPIGALGSYYFTLWYPGSTAFQPTLPLVINGSLLAIFNGANQTEFTQVASTGTPAGFLAFVVTILNPEINCVVSVSGAVITGPTAVEIVCSQLNFGFA